MGSCNYSCCIHQQHSSTRVARLEEIAITFVQSRVMSTKCTHKANPAMEEIPLLAKEGNRAISIQLFLLPRSAWMRGHEW